MPDDNAADVSLKLAQLKADALALDLKESISESKALRQEAEKAFLFEEVLRNSKDGVIITEANFQNEGGPTVIYVNEAFTRISGYTAEEMIGKTPKILQGCLLYTSPSPRDRTRSRMPSSA